MLKIYPYENTMTGQQEWIVEDTVLGRDVKTFVWPFARWRAEHYVKTHEGAPGEREETTPPNSP